MKISINNFKSIGSLSHYTMRPLTILSGTNSSGKSSFIQLLLLLKQTLDIDSSQRPLDLEGKFFKVFNYLDILKDKSPANKLKVEFFFNKHELEKFKNYPVLSLYDAFDDYSLRVMFDFDEIKNEKKIIVNNFEIEISPNDNEKTHFIKFENINSKFEVKTNVAVFTSNDLVSNNEDYIVKKINYSAFIPSEFEVEFPVAPFERPDGSMSKPSKLLVNEVPKLEGIKAILKDFFEKLNYVGPLRQAPKDEYSTYDQNNSVGIEGENVAEVLYKLSDKTIAYMHIEEKDSSMKFIKIEDTLLSAVKYWLCDRFALCADIYSKKKADSYVIYVKGFSGIESTIKHVGFGISQILPIIVEGLRINETETLVLEQPEIHLHPKVQSSLTDFLISLIQLGKRVIIETHSDHLITRLRRRIAEDISNQLDDKVLLTFVEVGKNDVLFKNIAIDDFGVIELPYPDGFIEKSDSELKAILKAQMNKRLNQ